MKCLSKLKPEPGVWMTEQPIPSYASNEVLIKINKTAVCGTDIHIYNWDQWAQKTIPTPMIFGHEFAGVIAEMGSDVSDYKIGDRVSGEGHLTCGACRNCRAGRRHLCRATVGVGVNREGCFAEYLVLPAENIFRLADDIPDEIGAILDPFGNAAHTALSFDMVGEDVLITGAGPIGIMAAKIARHVGARHIVITDVNDYRLKLAERMGVTRAVNVEKQSLNTVMQELGMTEGFDVGLEMSGNPQALNELIHSMNHGAHVALLGIPPENTAIDWSQVIFKGLFLKGIYGREMYETWYKMTSLLQSGLVLKDIITHIYPIGDYETAFETMASGQSGKIVLDWE